MTDINLGRVERLYTDSLEQHGAEPLGVGWRDATSHLLRFEKLVEVIHSREKDASVADLGCGYAALYPYLVERGYSISRYTGYDISEKMLGEAKRRLGHASDAELVCGASLTRTADYAIASGIFNVRFDEDEARWRDHILATLRNMNEYSARGFSFNLLSTYVDYKEPHLYYGDPLFFFDHCKKHFSRFVALFHDYPLYEWTIVVRK